MPPAADRAEACGKREQEQNQRGAEVMKCPRNLYEVTRLGKVRTGESNVSDVWIETDRNGWDMWSVCERSI